MTASKLNPLFFLLLCFSSPAWAQLIANHSSVSAFDNIPSSYVTAVSDNYQIFYGHTSHGSQIMTGLDMLGSSYPQPSFYEISDDLGDQGYTGWVDTTRDWLNYHSEYNLVMWSWCGGVSDNTESGINAYLNAMNQLEREYPDVTFVYMTGHLDGTGADGNLRQRNQQIRDYCQQNGKVLFDFEDIESYDPDGIYYADGSDACEWCTSWCTTNTCPSCDDCAHSHCFNCYVKGKAWWWMMAKLAGWDGTTTGVAPSITSHPIARQLRGGQSATFSCAAQGQNLSYQWLMNGSDLTGETSSSYTRSNVTSLDHGNEFWCRVSNPYGSALSNRAMITITGTPQYALWNGFLQMINILELVNTSDEDAAVTVTMYDINGTQTAQFPVLVKANSQYDVILNGVEGFSTDSYGVASVESSNSGIDGRLSFYRSEQVRSGYEFAFFVALAAPLQGPSSVAFNTYQPSTNPLDANNRVFQWLSVVNLDPSEEQEFLIYRFDQYGSQLAIDSETIESFRRKDLEGGHELPGPNAVGLNVIIPANMSAPYLAHLIRYGERPSSSETQYAFAFPLSAKRGSGNEQWVPISNGAGAANWLEVQNVSNQPTGVTVEFYDNGGNFLQQEDLYLNAYSQEHIYTTAILDESASGSARLIPASVNRGISAQSMFYFRDGSGSIEAMYGSQSKPCGADTQFGSYNLYLNMYNWLRIFNPTAQGQNITLRVLGQSETVHPFSLDAYSGIDLGLHNTATYGTALDSYGIVAVQGTASIELLRLRPEASGGIDFAAPTAVR